MKVKKFDKTLRLKKETVAHLGDNEMKNSKGGWTAALCTTSYDFFCFVTVCICE